MEISSPLEHAGSIVKQNFPETVPPTLLSESISLSSLVHHSNFIEHDLPLEEAEKAFREKKVDFLVLIDRGQVVGVCARVRLGAFLGSRYGFALYSGRPATLAQVDHPLVFTTSDPVRQVLNKALSRGDGEFHEDVALVDASNRLVGLISVEALAQLQSRLVNEQMDQLRRQGEILHRKDLDLFQSSHAHRQAKGLYQSLFESNALGVALLGSQGNVEAHNRRLAELLNLGDGQFMIPALDGWMDALDRERFQRHLAAHEKSLGRTPASAQEFTLNVADRGPRLFHITTGWIPETGQVCAFLNDITEQRILERNVFRQEKQGLLDTLVGGIAHELNNKLSPVMGYSELLLEQGDAASGRMASIILQSTKEAATIIRQLLQLSKPDLGQPRLFDLRSVVEESLLLTKFKIREHGCEMRVNFPSDEIPVQADPAKIKQVVMNLVLNALHAMDSVSNAVLTVSVSKMGQTAILTVADNGTGISADHLGRIFDPFFTTKGPDRGTGLGLSICYSIVTQFDGEIAVESQVGKGSSFSVTLPIGRGQQAALPAAKPVAVAPIGRSTRVLVVDDEEVVRLLLQEMLRTCFGCQVDTAANGADAMALIEATVYDLVISDIRMPVMAGPELYLRLRELRPSLSRHFVFITGHPGSKSLQDEIERWGVPVLAKPFSSASLLEVCRPLLVATDHGSMSA